MAFATKLPDPSSLFGATVGADNGLVQGLQSLFGGLGKAITNKEGTLHLQDSPTGRTLGSFLSVLMGGDPKNPITSVSGGGATTQAPCLNCSHNTCAGGSCSKCASGQCSGLAKPTDIGAPDQPDMVTPQGTVPWTQDLWKKWHDQGWQDVPTLKPPKVCTSGNCDGE